MSISQESDQASRPNSESGVPVSKDDGRLPLLVEEALADEIGHAVEEPVDPLEAEVGHPDFVGVGKPERDPVGPEALRGLREPLERGKLPVSTRSGAWVEPVIIASRLSAAKREDPVGDVGPGRAGDEQVAEPRRRSGSVSCRRERSCRRRAPLGAPARSSCRPRRRPPAASCRRGRRSPRRAGPSRSRPSSSSAAPSASSRFRPPRPCRRRDRVTVVSPPASRTSPGRKLRGRGARGARPRRALLPASLAAASRGVQPERGAPPRPRPPRPDAVGSRRPGRDPRVCPGSSAPTPRRRAGRRERRRARA